MAVYKFIVFSHFVGFENVFAKSMKKRETVDEGNSILEYYLKFIIKTEKQQYFVSVPQRR